MAIIPYRDVPATEAQAKDPPMVVAGQTVEEFFCGDERCDCATGHVRIAGVVMTVDLGTARVDFTSQEAATPAQEVLRASVRKALQEGGIEKLRQHYTQTRVYGQQQHFRYVDWSPLKNGELVPWQQVFRAEGTPMFTMTVTPPKKEPEAGASEAAPEEAPQQFLLGMQDAYCVEPKCDCHRVVWSVMTAEVGKPEQAQQLGKVRYSFASKEPQVLEVAKGVHPNQLFFMVANLLKGQPKLESMYAQRYAFLRSQLTPIMAEQRRQKTQARTQTTVGRNDPCPCGSGKKFKKCHGVAA